MERCFSIILILFLLLDHPNGEAQESSPAPAPSGRLDLARPRSADAITGSEFARRTDGVSGPERQQAALAELCRGNIPDFLRTLKPVHLNGEAADGQTHEVVIWVTPDYLAIGSDQDFLRIPLTYPSATAIAETLGCVLPTRKMVDSTAAQSAVRLNPQPLPPGPQMRSSAYYLKHQQMIEKQRASRPLGELISGHKKDVVLTNRLYQKPGRIPIYGWHRLDDRPIQPLSTVHGERYADYSHGIRLVGATVWIDGKPRNILDVLQDKELAPLLTYEALIVRPRWLLRRQK